MKTEELQQGQLPLRRLLRGTWQVYQGNLTVFVTYALVFSAPQFAAMMLLADPLKPPDVATALRLLAIAVPLALIAGYGVLATAWSVNRIVSGEPCDVRRGMRAALAATPSYLPASIALIVAALLAMGLFVLLMSGAIGALVATVAATHQSAPPLAVITVVAVVTASAMVVPALFAGVALSFFPMIAVLRAVPWTETLSRSHALVWKRWWRVFWMVLVLSLPGLLIGQGLRLFPHTIPFRAGFMLVQLVLAPFTTTGMTLLFLHLDFLGPALAPARSGSAPAAAEAIP